MNKFKIGDWEFSQEILDSIWLRLKSIKEGGAKIFPHQDNIFKAFELCPFDSVKVVIIGQDPYHNEVNGVPMANGLAFAQGVAADLIQRGDPSKGEIVIKYHTNSYTPPSLKNILSELELDVYNEPFNVERLEMSNTDAWGERQAKQGVLLLNTALTVEEGKPASHIDMWSSFTEEVMNILTKKEFVVWILWGDYAKKFKKFIPESHAIIEGVHPSPLSAYRGFFGSRPFSKVNKILEENDKTPIQW